MKVDFSNYIYEQSKQKHSPAEIDSKFGDILTSLDMTDEQEQVFYGISASFLEWQEEYLGKGIGSEMRAVVTEYSDDFVQIMAKAVKEGGYDDPKSFLESLSKSELEVVRRMNSLADPIYPQTLSEEGALNLLLPRNQAQDIDNDGFVMRGIARGFQFPPVNAPESVHMAWAEATEGMSEGDIMLMSGFFLIEMIGPNVKTDAEGNIIGFYEPEDPEFVNPFAAEDYSYTDMISKRLEGLEVFKNKMNYEDYIKRKDFYERFKNALNGS